jgi:hypothetical protein
MGGVEIFDHFGQGADLVSAGGGPWPVQPGRRGDPDGTDLAYRWSDRFLAVESGGERKKDKQRDEPEHWSVYTLSDGRKQCQYREGGREKQGSGRVAYKFPPVYIGC